MRTTAIAIASAASVMLLWAGAADADEKPAAPVARPVPADIPESLRKLLTDIQSAHAGRRSQAVRQLNAMGADAVPAITFLTGMLNEQRVWRAMSPQATAAARTPAVHAGIALRCIVAHSGAEHLPAPAESDNSILRGNLVWVLSRIKTPAAVKLLLAATADPETTVRVMALNALRESNDRAVVQAKLAALKDPDADIRAAAARGLPVVGPPPYVERLRAVPALAALTEDPSSHVRYAVAGTLGAIGGGDVLDPLVAMLKDRDRLVRYASAESLGKVTDRRAVTPLLAALKADKTVARHAMIRALGALEDIRATPALIERLRDDLASVRRDTAWAMGKLRDRRAVKPLLTVLNDDERDVRRAVAEALGDIGDARAVEPLIAQVRTRHSRTAAVALGKFDDPRAIQALADVLMAPGTKGVYPPVGGAADALAQIRHPDAVRRLVDAGINSPNPRASDAARRSVSKLMNLRHKYDVEQLKLWWAQHRHEFETTAADPKAGDERH